MAVERRLAAVLAADVVGYSRLMESDEIGTLRTLREHSSAFIEPLIATYKGRIVKTMGDGMLVEFASAVDAVTCASVFSSDKGRFETNTDVQNGYGEPFQDESGAGSKRALAAVSLYPPRIDVTRCSSTGCNDHIDVACVNAGLVERPLRSLDEQRAGAIEIGFCSLGPIMWLVEPF